MIKNCSLEGQNNLHNIYVLSNRASRYMREKLIELQGELNKSTFIVEEVNISISKIDRSSNQEINKVIVDLNNTLINLV